MRFMKACLSVLFHRFGMATMLFTFIPIVGLVFSFTNTVGAALWAAEIEAKANIIDGPGDAAASSSKKIV